MPGQGISRARILMFLRSFCADLSSRQLSAMFFRHLPAENRKSLRISTVLCRTSRKRWAERFSKSWLAKFPAANLRNKILDFREFDSSRILMLRGENPRPIGNFPESLSQGILVGTILVGRLGVLLLYITIVIVINTLSIIWFVSSFVYLCRVLIGRRPGPEDVERLHGSPGRARGLWEVHIYI